MAFRLAAALALGGVLSCLAWAGALPAGPPATPVGSASETHFGTTVDDPYRWLEDLRAPETRRWFENQNDYARATLDALPGRAALRDRLDALTADEVRVDNAQFGGNRVFYLKRDVGATVSALYVREGLNGVERRVVDPTQGAAADPPARIAFYRAAPNGKRLAYGLAQAGSALALLHVIDVDSGLELGPAMPVVSAGNPAQWRIDSGALFYAQHVDVTATANPAARLRDATLWMREFDMDGNSRDHRLLDPAVDTTLDLQPDDRVRIHVGASSWAVVSATRGSAREAALFVAPLASLHVARPHWHKLLDASAGVVAVALRGEWVYLLTNTDAPRRRIVRWSLVDPRPFALADAEVVLEESERVITGISAARDALYVSERDGGNARLMRLEYNVKLARPARRARRKTPAALPKVAGVARSTDVALPIVGSIEDVVTDPTRNGALVRLSGWTQAPAWFAIDGKGAVTRTSLLPPSGADFHDILITHFVVRARDGIDVPVCVLQRRDVVHDGQAPALLYAYGAYGVSPVPDFVPARLAWLERGGLLAFADVRGGGDPGDDWHRAGMLANKPNTWHDLVDVADYLVRNQWTSAARLAIQGGGKGGIAVGNAMVERPDLFRAVISESGEHDLVRAEAAMNGHFDVPELGSVANEQGFRARLAMSSYYRVQKDVAYPAMLSIAAYGVSAGDLWQVGKMTAALQAAAASVAGAGRPVLLRVDFASEPSSGAAHFRSNDQQADIYAFALWQLGDPAFQPPAP
jgi:prolyl oligopeptidase